MTILDPGSVPTATGGANDQFPQAPIVPGRFLDRSEEHVHISTHVTPARRVRLEKFVVTETRTLTVQVRREEARLVEVDDIDFKNANVDAVSGAADADGDAGQWLTLHEERVVVATEVVPTERVRLSIDTVVEQREVAVEMRSERIHLETTSSPTDTDSGPSAAAR